MQLKIQKINLNKLIKLKNKLRNLMEGIFYGVGVGSEDSELLTIKAVKTIQNADVIIAPRTEKQKESIAFSIAEQYIPKRAKIIFQIFPMTKNKKLLNEAWLYNKNEIVKYLKRGKKVVFLTLGDPMIFSTYINIFIILKDEGFHIKTIPGIPSFCAIAARLGVPLVKENEILSIIPATVENNILQKVLKNSENIVLMKVSKNFDEILNQLRRSGHIKNAILVSRSGLNDEIIHDNLETNKFFNINYLSTIVAKKK